MDFKSLLDNNWLDRVIIAAWILSAILVIFMLTNLDVIVNYHVDDPSNSGHQEYKCQEENTI